MKADHFYTIGDTHDVCQDFAYSTILSGGIGVAAIADGCSSSQMLGGLTDVGARCLTLAAFLCIKRNCLLTSSLSTFEKKYFNGCQEKLGKETFHLVKRNEFYYSIPALSMDSTLLLTVANSKEGFVFCYGDGIVHIEYKNGVKEFHIISYTSGAPYYLSYTADISRDKMYASLGDGKLIHTICQYGDTTEACTINHKELDIPTDNHSNLYIFSSFKVENFRTISVMSDGFSSFLDENNKEYSFQDIALSNSLSYKNNVGVFVQRRMKKFLNVLKKRSISHYDDLSIAALISE